VTEVDVHVDPRGRPLIASVATAQQLDIFNRGLCHALAIVLHDRHGWPLRLLGSPCDEWSMRPFSQIVSIPSHVYCINDAGLPVDVNGVFADELAIQRFFNDAMEPEEATVSMDIDRAVVLEKLWDHGFQQLTGETLRLTAKHADRLALHALR
jgi:hypothetical protein